MDRRMPIAIATGLLLAIVSPTDAEWMRFRGPNGSGVSTDPVPLPTKFSANENLQWKTPLPGLGHSSPIVVGNRVFVTAWSGYGLDPRDPGDQDGLQRHLICIDRTSGDVIWDRQVAAVLPEDRYGGMFAEHGYATHTPVSDGERVYVYFGKTGALAFDLEGNQLWQIGCGTESDPRGWGSAASPMLYEDLLIVTASAESEALVGLNKHTGEEMWRQEATGLNSTWGTPILVPGRKGRTDLVLGVPFEIWGFNPDSGKMRWFCEAMDTNSYCSGLVTDGELVYGVEGRSGGSIAVRLGGKGDVTESHVVWTGNHNNRIGTPVLHEGRLYFFSRGVATCLDAQTGEEIFKQRLQRSAVAEAAAADESVDRRGRRRGRGRDYSSPVIGDGKVYYVSRSGDIHVIRASADFEPLATNRLTDAPEDFSATPCIDKGALLIRSSKHLYCVASANAR